MSLDLSFRLARPGFVLEVEASLPGRGVISLFGRSGSGKTTLLRCVAGLEPTVQGQLTVNGERWLDRSAGLDLPPHRRGVGYVFQETTLFPHLSVRGNLEYGWKRSPEASRRVPFDEAVELLGVEPFLERRPESLSGGERQRVAVARALLAGPAVLLLDEPLAGLDRQSRRTILPYLERLFSRLEIPVLHVSHDPREVERLAGHVVMIEAGRIVAEGPLAELEARLQEDPDEALG